MQALTENDKQLHTVFSVNMLEFLENDDFGDRIVFSDEATLHINGRVNSIMFESGVQNTLGKSLSMSEILQS